MCACVKGVHMCECVCGGGVQLHAGRVVDMDRQHHRKSQHSGSGVSIRGN